MGIVHSEITLRNLYDYNLAQGGLIKPEEVRTETVTAVADTGSMYLVIVVHAMIIPGAKKVLFGAIPMEAMDLMVNPVTQEVVGAHGDSEEFLAL